MPVYPFICVPRKEKGTFYLYAKSRYWEVVATGVKDQLEAYEVQDDWATRTGRKLTDNTWPSAR